MNYFTSIGIAGLGKLAEANWCLLNKLLLAGAYENSACAGADGRAEAVAASDLFHKLIGKYLLLLD